MSKSVLSLLLLGLLALPLLTGCGVGEASPDEPVTAGSETPVPVSVASPVRGEIVATWESTATLDTDGDAAVLARVGGDLIELLVEEGEQVAEGQPLARLDGERLRLEMLAAKANLDRAVGEYARQRDLHQRGLVSEAMYDELRYDVDSLRALYQLRQLEYGYAVIRAPIAGVVSERSVKLGQTLKPGDSVFRITSTDELIAELRVPQSEHGRIAAGHRAELRVDALPARRFAADIIRVSPTIDTQNGTFRVTARIVNADGSLAPGMFARFSIAWERHSDALLIPSAALLREDERYSVYVVVDGAVELRQIQTGLEARGMVEILGGLDTGDVVVVGGQSALRDGSRVLASATPPQRLSG